MPPLKSLFVILALGALSVTVAPASNGAEPALSWPVREWLRFEPVQTLTEKEIVRGLRTF
jgi:hypothetical protein